jgi:hypothetical protein
MSGKFLFGFMSLTIVGCALNPVSEPASSEAPLVTESATAVPILPFPGDAGCPGVGTVFCINGGHWDPAQCSCVPPAGAQCATDFDCPQPGLACQQCSPDVVVCPSDRCVNGKCTLNIPTCPPPIAPKPTGGAGAISDDWEQCRLVPSSCNCTFPPCPWDDPPPLGQ